MDIRELYQSHSEEELPSDYLFDHIRSFSFAKAQKNANERLHRIDEIKAVLDQAVSKEAFKDYKSLKEDILGSYLEEADVPNSPEAIKEKKKHNRKAGLAISNFLFSNKKR